MKKLEKFYFVLFGSIPFLLVFILLLSVFRNGLSEFDSLSAFFDAFSSNFDNLIATLTIFENGLLSGIATWFVNRNWLSLELSNFIFSYLNYYLILFIIKFMFDLFLWFVRFADHLINKFNKKGDN